MNRLAIATAILATTIAAQAEAYDRDAWVLGVGVSQAFDSEDKGLAGNIEYRSSAISPENTLGIDNVSWIVGAEIDTNSSTYGYAGLLYDYAINDKWSITPSLAAGFYSQGSGKDLGGALEFRQNLEVSYKFTDQSRVGLAISHKSNASLYRANPGTETIQAVYSVSLD